MYISSPKASKFLQQMASLGRVRGHSSCSIGRAAAVIEKKNNGLLFFSNDIYNMFVYRYMYICCCVYRQRPSVCWSLIFEVVAGFCVGRLFFYASASSSFLATMSPFR